MPKRDAAVESVKPVGPRGKITADQLDLYVTKPATPLQAAFADWVPGSTGYDPATARSKSEAFKMGVKLALNTHKFFQKSDLNRERAAEDRAARENERIERDKAREQRKVELAAKKDDLAAKRAERQARKDAKAQEAEDKEKQPAAKKATPAKKAASKKPSGPRIPPRKGAKAKEAETADF